MATQFNVYWSMEEYLEIYSRFLYNADKHAYVDALHYNLAKDKLWIPLHIRHKVIKPMIDKSIVVFMVADWDDYRHGLVPVDIDYGMRITAKNILFTTRRVGAWWNKDVDLFWYPIAKFHWGRVNEGMPDFNHAIERYVTHKFHSMYYDLDMQALNIILNRKIV